MNDQDKANYLFEEYKLCFNEYAYRDRLGVTLFTVILSVITFLLAGFMLKNNVIQQNQSLFIMVLGLGLLFVLHLDLQKTLSCKSAMHNRARTLEETLQKVTGESEHFHIMRSIDNRERGYMERLSRDKFTVSNSMLRITELFAIVWVLSFYKQMFSLVEALKLFVVGQP
jgi:hypothetical protein